jgi:hypothetical protein
MLMMIQINPELAKSTPSDSLPVSSTGRPNSAYQESQSHMSRNPSISSRHSFFGGNTLDANPDGVGDDADEEEEVPVGHHFTFIPPNPKKFYRRLLEYCLVTDLEIMLSPEVNDTDEVSLGILSAPHIDLINECALRWRIGQSYRASCFLDLVRQFFERSEVPLECVPEALQNVTKVMHDSEFENWPTQDVSFYLTVFVIC